MLPFSKTPRQNPIQTDTLASLLDPSVRIEGTLRFSKSVRLDGEVIGDIEGPLESGGLLIIGASAKVYGNVRCHSIVILGQVHGDVSGYHLELRSSAQINGCLEYTLIEIHQGAVIHGQMIHGSAPAALPVQTLPGLELSELKANGG